MTDEIDPVDLEIMRRQLEGVAEEMGRTLIRGAYSPNIKERRDASTALFDTDGRLIAQAEHIPVHLGAMPDAVDAVIEHQSAVGETYILNDPYHGGSHLPDVTVVGPIITDGHHLGYGATRAHWADIGGPTPGGLSGDARTIFAEGLRIPPTPITTDGDIDDDVVEFILANVRQPNLRKADLMAQLGAIEVAQDRCVSLVDDHGVTHLERAFDAVIEYSRRRIESKIGRLPDGTYQAEDYLEGPDEHIPIAASVTIHETTIEVDFAGTASQTTSNLNAPPAVAKSAVYFMVRCLTDDDIPSNHGCYEPIEISIPGGSLLDPTPPSAVGGGNVETSQRIVDVLLSAFRSADPTLPAHGQGTMNNVVIGFDTGETYYETIGGGGGATPTRDGTDGIHVGMTNTRNTPVEALERAYPLLVERYGLRIGSGGNGRYRGGCGIERTLVLEAPALITVLTDRRVIGPPGAAGGGPGSVGENRLDGEDIGAKATIRATAGSELTILTPGGGGYGEPSTEKRSGESKSLDDASEIS